MTAYPTYLPEAVAGLENLADFGTRGFACVPSFLSDEEVQWLLRDYENVPPEPNANYRVRRVSPEVLPKLEQKCQRVAREVKRVSGVDADLLNDAVYFATFTDARTLASPGGTTQKFPWHQDHETYWQWQDVYNYLNFFIPILKPEVERSNLGVIPFDKLQQQDPELAKKLHARGATRVLHRGRHWVVTNDEQGGKLAKLDWDPSELEEVPPLAAGDLLLMRGDLMHRTQDADSRRIAVSARMSKSDALIRRSMLVKGGLVKTAMLFSARTLFEPYFECLDASGGDSVTNQQMLQFLDERKEKYRLVGTTPPKCSRAKFIKRLIREKLRS